MASYYTSSDSEYLGSASGAFQGELNGDNLSDTSSMATIMTTAVTDMPLVSENNINSSELILNYLQDQSDQQLQIKLQQEAEQNSSIAQTSSPINNISTVSIEDMDSIVNVTREFPMDYAMVMFGYMTPVVLLITIITNTLVVMVLYQRHMRTPTNIVLFTMAIVDLGTLLTPSPWYLYIYTFGNHNKFLYPPAACYAHYIMTDVIPIFFHTSSIWLALLLASQRYVYVCHPTTARTWCTIPRVKGAIILILSVAFLHQSTHFFDNTFTAVTIFYQGKQHNACKNGNADWVAAIDIEYYYMAYFFFRIFFVYLIPCVALITLNYLLFRALKRAQNRRFELLRTRFRMVGPDTMTSYNESNSHRNNSSRNDNYRANQPRHNYSVAGYEVAREVSSFINEPSGGKNVQNAQKPLFNRLRNNTRQGSSAGLFDSTCDGGSGDDRGCTTLAGPIENESKINFNNNTCVGSLESIRIVEKRNKRASANCSGSASMAQQEEGKEPASVIDRNSSQDFSSSSSFHDSNDLNKQQASSFTDDNDMNRTHSSSVITVGSNSRQQATSTGETVSCELHQSRNQGECSGDGRGEKNDSLNLDEDENETNEDSRGGNDLEENDEDESNCAECAAYDRQFVTMDGASVSCAKCSSVLINDGPATIAACERETGGGRSGRTSGAPLCQDLRVDHNCESAKSQSFAATKYNELDKSGEDGGVSIAMVNYESPIGSASIRADKASTTVEGEQLVEGSGSSSEAGRDKGLEHEKNSNCTSGVASNQLGLEQQLDNEKGGQQNDRLATSDSADSRINCGCLSSRRGPLGRLTLLGKIKRRRAKAKLARQDKSIAVSGDADYGNSETVCSNSELSMMSLKRYFEAKSSKMKSVNHPTNQGHNQQTTAPINANHDLGGKKFKLPSLRSSQPAQRRLMSFEEETIGEDNMNNQLELATSDNSHSTTGNSHSTVSIVQVQDSASNRTSDGVADGAVLNSATSSSSTVRGQRAKSPSFAGPIGGPSGFGSGSRAAGSGSRATLIGQPTTTPMIVSSNGQQGAQAAATMPAQSMRTMDSNRTTLMLVVVVSVFLVVEVPAAIVTIIHVVLNLFDLSKDYAFWSKLNYIKLFTNFFIMISYSVNFTIYCSMSKKFRETFRDLWFCGRESRRKRARRSLRHKRQQQQHSQYITTNNS